MALVVLACSEHAKQAGIGSNELRTTTDAHPLLGRCLSAALVIGVTT